MNHVIIFWIMMERTAFYRFYIYNIASIINYSPEIAEKIRKIEDDTDHYEDILGTYLTRLSKSQVSDEDSATVTKLA